MLKTFYRSLFDTDWLVTQRDRFGRAWVYVLVFMGVVSAISAGVLARNLPPVFAQIKTKVEQNVPDFQAELKGGVLTVVGPQQWEIKEEGIRAVFDVRATSTATIDGYRNSDEAVILLTSTTLSVFDNDSGSTQTMPLAEYGDGKWTKADLVQAANWGTQRGAQVLGLIFFGISWLLGVVVKSLYAGVVAVVMWLVFRKNQNFAATWNRRQVWTVALYAITLPTLLQQIGHWTGLMIPGLYTLVLGTVVYLVLRTPVAPVTPKPEADSASVDTHTT